MGFLWAAIVLSKFRPSQHANMVDMVDMRCAWCGLFRTFHCGLRNHPPPQTEMTTYDGIHLMCDSSPSPSVSAPVLVLPPPSSLLLVSPSFPCRTPLFPSPRVKHVPPPLPSPWHNKKIINHGTIHDIPYHVAHHNTYTCTSAQGHKSESRKDTGHRTQDTGHSEPYKRGISMTMNGGQVLSYPCFLIWGSRWWNQMGVVARI